MVLAQRPEPEEASLESLRIVFVLVLVYRKNLDLPPISGIGSCKERPQVGIERCDKFLSHVYKF